MFVLGLLCVTAAAGCAGACIATVAGAVLQWQDVRRRRADMARGGSFRAAWRAVADRRV